MSRAERPFGIVARFESPASLMRGCEALRDAGYKNFDAHSPFAIHGLERAMGLHPTRLPYLSLVGGIIGGAGGFLLQWWVHACGYPQNISGKPFFAYPAYVPITFELTVLVAAFGTFFGLWGLTSLPRLFHPTMQHPSFGRATDDSFFISIESIDPRYDVTATSALLAKVGGLEIMEVQP